MVTSFQFSTLVGTLILSVIALPTIQAGYRPEAQQQHHHHQQQQQQQQWKQRHHPRQQIQHDHDDAVRKLGKILDNGEEIVELHKGPKEIDVDPESTYNHKFMALMNSPCRPETDGYFGSTAGQATRIQYGFRLEVQPLSQIMDLLDIIEDRIVDSILMNAFPKMCGLDGTRRRMMAAKEGTVDIGPSPRGLEHVDGHSAGFRFFRFEEAGESPP
jgi:hypothetical protein